MIYKFSIFHIEVIKGFFGNVIKNSYQKVVLRTVIKNGSQLIFSNQQNYICNSNKKIYFFLISDKVLCIYIQYKNL